MKPPSSRIVRSLLLFAGCCAVAALAPRGAHADGELTVAIAAIDDSAFPVVTAVFTVDDGGRPVTAIPEGGLTASEAGAAATVLSVVNAPDAHIPLGLLIAIDTSGSMAGANIVQSQAAASALIRSLAAGDSGAVITFSDTVRIAAPFTPKGDELTQAIASVRAEGNTALYDAVGQSAKLAAASGIGRRAVVLLSDGEDFGGRSALNREQALAQASSGGALFYVIGVGSETDRAFLQEVAQRSGGRYFEAQSAADIPGIFSAIQAVLRSQFVATIRSSAPGESRSRSINLSVAVAGKTGSRERTYETLRPPVVQQPTVTPAPTSTPAPTVTAAPALAPSGGGNGKAVAAALAAGAVLFAAVAALFIRRRRSRSRPPELVRSAAATPLPARASAPRPEGAGRITVTRGSQTLETIDVDAGPVTIGAAATCTLRLPAEAGVQDEHARLWWRDGSPMVHSLGRAAVTLLNGEPVEWASLGDGDELTVGPFVLRYNAAKRNGLTP